MKTRLGLCIAFAATILSAQAASAQSDLVDATNPTRLADVIRGLGYRAQLQTDSGGDPMIESSVSGTSFSLFFYGCTANADCKSVDFATSYDATDSTTLDAINEWNAGELFGKAYLDTEDNSLRLVAHVNMVGGISQANFEDTFAWWEEIVEGFEDDLGL
jgi:hypothetical protein